MLAGAVGGDAARLAERLGGSNGARADALRRNSVFALLERGDVLVCTVGPFAKWGEPAVRAAIAARGTYIDSTGEPTFIRRVFEEFGRAGGERAGAALLTAMGYDFVPGALAGALALEEAGEAAVRVDVGYYALGAGISAGTRRVRGRRDARRQPRVPRRRAAAGAHGGARALVHGRGKEREAMSIGGAEHLALPAAYPRLREINVYLGWFGGLARPCRRRAWRARWRCGCRGCAA